MPTFPPENAPPPLPLAVRAGSLLGAGTVAAVLASVPAALRVASESHGAAVAWIALAACATVPASIAVALLRSAREGVRSFAGQDMSLAAWSVATWALASFLVLTALGGLLRATTHHHGLAGVTFAIAGLACVFVTALVVRRVGAVARDSDPFARAAILGASIVALVVALLLVALRVARASDGATLTSSAGDTFVDLLAFAIAVGLFSRPELARASWLARAGVPLALGIVALGLALLTRDPSLAAGIRAHAPLVSPLAALAAN
jgi:choline-sulfatase